MRTLVKTIGVLAICLPLALLFMLTQPFVAPRSLPGLPAVDVEKLKQHVETLTLDCFPRSHHDPEMIERAATYIRNRFTTSATAVYEQFFEVDEFQHRNILACYGPGMEEGGCNPTAMKGKELIIVGAHYDGYNDFSNPFYYPAADDNASGVAGLLELGRMLGEYPPKSPVMLVAYTLEEPPYFGTDSMGSAEHARSLLSSEIRTRAVIVLEMIGFFSDEPGSQSYPLPGLSAIYPDTGNFIGVIGRVQDALLVRTLKKYLSGVENLPVYSLCAPAQLRGVDFSDHRNYWAKGMSAVMVTDTAFFRNYAYHTVFDTAESLDYPRMAKVVQGVFAAVANL